MFFPSEAIFERFKSAALLARHPQDTLGFFYANKIPDSGGISMAQVFLGPLSVIEGPVAFFV